MPSRIVAFSLLLASLACFEARAADFSLDLEAQPLEVTLLGNVQPPGSQAAAYFVDTASGFHARLHAYFLHLSLDFHHYYGRNFDLVHAGLGYQHELPLDSAGLLAQARCYVRGQLGFFLIGARLGESDATYDSEVGGRLGGTMAFEFQLNRWALTSVHVDLGAFWAGRFGFSLGLYSTLGLKI